MNLIIIDPREIDPADTVVLSGDRARHISSILKKKPAETVRAGIAGGPQGDAELIAVDGDRVVLRFHAETAAPAEPPVDLVLALPRPIMLQRILSQASPLGIARIFLIRSSRVEKSYFQASLLRPDKYLPLLHHGMAQAMDTWQPEVYVVNRFHRFIDEVLPDRLARCPVRLVPHPETEDGLENIVPMPLRQRVMLAIGPEGGWIPHEITRFREQGFRPVHLGSRILRVETVVPVILGQLDLLRRLTVGSR